MRAALACLVFAYVLSQFYRAFLAVLSPLLTADIGVMLGSQGAPGRPNYRLSCIM